MDIRSHVIALNEKRLKAAKALNDFVDDCHKRHPGETFSAEEREQYDLINGEIDTIDAEVRSFVAQETREQESAALREAHASVFGEARPTGARDHRGEFRSWLRGEVRNDQPDPTEGGRRKNVFAIRAEDIVLAARERDLLRRGASPDEIRALLWDTGSIASAVPTSMARSLYEILEASIAMFRMPTTKFQTASGENMDFPKLTTHSIATQVVAQGTAIGGTDPVYGKVTFGAFKYGELVQVSSEAVTDTVFDVVGHVTNQVGRAVGRVIDADLVVGTGTGEPLGVMAAITGAGTIATGGSLVDPNYEKLIDLQYSVNDEYRNGGNAAWLTRDSTAGTLRKLRDGQGGTEGSPLWTPVLTNGLPGQKQPDLLLGDPLFTDPNVASLASNAKIMAYGDFSAYYIRQVGDFIFERSDDFAFDTDLVTFRGKWRCDGDVIDSAALNIMKRSV